MNAVDTNIIFYAHDIRDPAKQAIASELIENLTDGVLLWQVACEYLASSRKLSSQGQSLADARAALADLQQAWVETAPDWSLLDVAVGLTSRHSLSFWDALIVAACDHAGVNVLYSEDLGGRPPWRGVTFVNPFAQ